MRREFLVVLTRQPVEGRTFTVAEATASLDTWRSAASVLDEDEAVLAELLSLVRARQVRGKQVHDANVVAVMLANGITRLATFNAADFQRFDDDIRIEPVAS